MKTYKKAVRSLGILLLTLFCAFYVSVIAKAEKHTGYDVTFVNGAETAEREYTGKAIKPKVYVYMKLEDGTSTQLIKDKDYQLSYNNNVNASVKGASVTVTGTKTGSHGDLSDLNKILLYSITPIDLKSAKVTLSSTSCTYNGSARRPKVTVIAASGVKLVKGTDYNVTYSNNKNAGTAKVSVTGTVNATGTVVKKFTIKRRSLVDAKVTISKKYYIYKGKPVRPKVRVQYGSTVLKLGKHYKVVYSNNTGIGKATITIKALKATNYKSKTSIRFGIKPAKPTLKSLQMVKGGVKASWSKVKGVTGYIVYRRAKGEKKYTRLAVTKSTSYTDKKITSGATYVYTIKAYKKGSYKSKKSNLEKIVIFSEKPKLEGQKTASSIIVKWKSLAGATKYKLFRRVDGKDWKVVLEQKSATSFVDTSVEKGHTYEYQLIVYAGTIRVSSNRILGKF